MKNINPFALPQFHGITTKDPDNFLFELGINLEVVHEPIREEHHRMGPNVARF
jgi:hypothetical protein